MSKYKVLGIWYRVLGIWTNAVHAYRYRHVETTYLVPQLSVYIERVAKRYVLDIGVSWFQWCLAIDVEVTVLHRTFRKLIGAAKRILKVAMAAVLTWLVVMVIVCLWPLLFIVSMFMIHDAWLDSQIVDEDHAWYMANQNEEQP